MRFLVMWENGLIRKLYTYCLTSQEEEEEEEEATRLII